MLLQCYKYTDRQTKELIRSMTILVDTRQKENSHITKYFQAKGIQYKTKALDHGDYSFLIPKNEELSIPRDLVFSNHIMIERKASLEEISGNLSQERARFQKEMALAPENKIILLQNASYMDLVDGNYRTQYKVQSFLATLHTFWHRYNCPIFFMPDRRYSGLFIHKYFEYWIKEQLK